MKNVAPSRLRAVSQPSIFPLPSRLEWRLLVVLARRPDRLSDLYNLLLALRTHLSPRSKGAMNPRSLAEDALEMFRSLLPSIAQHYLHRP